MQGGSSYEDDEAETPRTHVQAFLSNVGTDPSFMVSSKRSDKRRITRSFVKTPLKEKKAQKDFPRLSTSLPSPGSLITPRSNIQQLLLGTDPAKTPFERRVSSVRSSRSHSKSLLDQISRDRGQKVSLTPKISASTTGIEEESPAKVFKPSQQSRSFHIPDPPVDPERSSLRHQAESHTSRHSDEESEDDVDDQHFRTQGTKLFKPSQQSRSFHIPDPPVDPERSSLRHHAERHTSRHSDEEIGDDADDQHFPKQVSSSHVYQGSTSGAGGHYDIEPNRNSASENASPSKEMVHALEKMSKNLQAERASQIYELNSESTGTDRDDSLNVSGLASSLSLGNRSVRKLTLSKTMTPVKNFSYRQSPNKSKLSDSKWRKITPASNSKQLRLSHSGNRSSFIKGGKDMYHVPSPNKLVIDFNNSNSSSNSNPSGMKSLETSVEAVTPRNSNNPVQNSVTGGNFSSRSKRGSSVKRTSYVGMDSLTSSSNKKRQLVEDGDGSSNPPSSTPFKRSKSVFSSTRMQASLSHNLTAKDPDPHCDVDGFSTTIGDLSPIRPDSEQEQRIQSPEMASSDNDEHRAQQNRNSVSKHSEHAKSSVAHMSRNEMFDDEESDEMPSGYSPLKTPVIDWSKRPQPLNASSARIIPPRVEAPVVKGKGGALAKKKTVTKKTPPIPTSILPRNTVKFYSQLYASMKMDKGSLDELEKVSQEFLVNTLETVEKYCLHAGRKTINEADFVLLMKVQKLAKNKEEVYDLIRKYLPMELRMELIPCFPSRK